MSLVNSPGVVTNGLVFACDMSNGKSYAGAPLTNVLPTPAVNGYPTVGNGWGTYNTNQYGSGTYFSIGTIASVSSNIVTTTTNHPLRTYDVMQPQTTGGGVTAGTNYFVKKISDTQFSLHAYNSSQDGSQGYINPSTGFYKVWDSIATDTRISINATSFPTMWWGAPHLPNSGLVKEIISKGFTGIPGRAPTDCVRCYHTRPDGVTDGMAYGVDATVTAGVPWTVSFWTRSITASCVGQNLSYQIYNYGDGAAAGYGLTAYLGPVGVWKKHYLTFTPTDPYCISYWFPSTGNMIYDISNIQFELGSVANNFAAGTRSTTQSLLDLTRTCTVTVSNLTYNSDNTFGFNGSNSYATIATPLSGNTSTPFTLMAWAKTTTASGWQTVIGTGGTYRQIGFLNNAFYYGGNGGGGNQFVNGGTISANTWCHLAFTFDGTTAYGYLNGVQTTGNIGSNGGTIGSNYLGVYSPAYELLNGSIGAAMIYNRALTAAEVRQNFNALRGRFGV